MSQILIVVVLVLIVVAGMQLLRIFTLLNNNKAKEVSTATDKDNDINGKLMLIVGYGFLLFAICSIIAWNPFTLAEAASEHGPTVDGLLNTTWIFLLIVFFSLHAVLFFAIYKFRGNSKRKADYSMLVSPEEAAEFRKGTHVSGVPYFLHDNKLEKIWTIIPAVVFAVLITYGLITWNNIFYYDVEEDDPIVVEVYAQQFNWTVRYAGMYDSNPASHQLGDASVRFIEGANVLGVDLKDPKGQDDIVTKELHLPVNRRVVFKFRSQDVMHSAYMPHFRAQMNCVPGMITEFSFVPTLTTADYRELSSTKRKVARINDIREQRNITRPATDKLDYWEFDYLLLCNKICGATHYNMQMNIVVETEEEFNAWLSEQAKDNSIKNIIAAK